jgi:hypothetical protein
MKRRKSYTVALAKEDFDLRGGIDLCNKNITQRRNGAKRETVRGGVAPLRAVIADCRLQTAD